MSTVDSVTLVLVALTLAVAAIGVWYARRGALAAEKENEVFGEELEAQRERSKPNVEVAVTETRHVSTGSEGTTVGIHVHVLNRSKEPEMVQGMTVECEGIVFNWPPAHPSLRQTNRESPQQPFALTPGEPQKLAYAFGPVLQLPLSDLEAELIVTCRDAGERRTAFTFRRS